MFRYKLRTLLIVLAVLPPLLAAGYLLWMSGQKPRRPDGPIIYQAKFIGNRCFSDSKLTHEIGLKQVFRLDMDSAEQSRLKITQLYLRAGYPQATVQLLEGGKDGDKTLAFKISEGKRARSTEHP
jgi:outer membrane protein assembly factor BamA